MTQIEKIAQEIQLEILKNAIQNKPQRIVWEEYDGNILVTINGYALYIIPKSLWFINLGKITPPSTSVLSIIKEDEQETSVDFTGVVIQTKIANKKYELYELGNEKFKTYVDKKLFKPFYDNCKYKSKSSLDNIKVYLGDFLVGVVMPVKRSGNL